MSTFGEKMLQTKAIADMTLPAIHTALHPNLLERPLASGPESAMVENCNLSGLLGP